MRDGQLRPGFIDHGMEQSKLEVVLDGDVFGEPLTLGCRQLGQDILAVET